VKNDEDLPDESNEDNEHKNDLTGYLVMFVIFGIFAGYIALEWFFGSPSPDCSYTNQGCYGDHNRWGQ
jgi:hypothetical protein